MAEDITPGAILLVDYLEPLGISQKGLANSIGVPLQYISEIVAGTRSITADTSERLGRFFAQSPLFWLHVQIECDRRTCGDAEQCSSEVQGC